MPQDLPEIIRIGTRKSKLALTQATMVHDLLVAQWPELAARIELAPMLTTGDRITDRPLAEVGGKGLFAKELDEALLSGHIHLAVHSAKDMESFLPKDLNIIATLEREDNTDAFVSTSGAGFMALPAGAVVGTASVRRAAQALVLRKDIAIHSLRGNVPTRIEKVTTGVVDATFLALAGLKRLGLAHVVTERCDREHFLPAAGQGIISIVCREDTPAIHALLSPLNHLPSFHALMAERAVLAVLDGSCRTPIAAWARMDGDALHLTSAVYAQDGAEMYLTERHAPLTDAANAGRDAGQELRRRGGHLLPKP